MQFVLLIHQGTTPTPTTDGWSQLSTAEQQAIYADYAALNETPGVSPGLPLGLPDQATTVRVVRRGPDRDRRTVPRRPDQGRRRLLPVRGRRRCCRRRPGRPHPRRPVRASQIRPVATYW